MNRYFLVVSPGLERLLYREIQDYIPRLKTNPAKVYFTTGGIELDCIFYLKQFVICSIERGISASDFEIETSRSSFRFISYVIESMRLRLSRFHASQWYELENGVNHLPLSLVTNNYKEYNVDLHIVS